ncbi:MAG: YaeQ family protein [Betaproteobacteria bacterium]
MALKATVFKAELDVADTDRGHYGHHALTIARHPSETDERLMVRLLAFALNAGDSLAFGRGLSSDDEPALWQRDLTGVIETWIDVGLPDEKQIRKACGRAGRVVVYTYGSGAALWWRRSADSLARLDRLAVVDIPAAASRALAELAQRTMTLHCTIQDGHVWMTAGERTVEIQPVTLKPAA